MTGFSLVRSSSLIAARRSLTIVISSIQTGSSAVEAAALILLERVTVHILICECGMRLKAPGAKPGRVGRCPECGRRLQVPGFPEPFRLKPDSAEPAMANSGGTGEPIESGGSVYQLLPEAPPNPNRGKRPAANRELEPKVIEPKSRDTRPMADGLLPVLERPESSWFASFLYPLRSIECMSVIAILSGVFWLFLILVPEYCLAVMGDADSMG